MKQFISAVIMALIVYGLGTVAVVMLARDILPQYFPWISIFLGVLYIILVSIVISTLNNGGVG